MEARKQDADRQQTGALPDFVIIGAQKGGTSFLYHTLRGHPFFEATLYKTEVHFFDTRKFKEGVEWYRAQFPPPRWEDGRRVITGESSPYYMFHPHTPCRMVQTIPQAKLIVLLRDPVDRAYSDYHHKVRRGNETLTFEEALEAEEERLRGEREKMLRNEDYRSVNHRRHSYTARGIYVDQLKEWHRYFDPEQMLIIKSEDLYEDPQQTIKPVQEFLGLPQRDLQPTRRRNKGQYREPMAPETRQRLQKYFEPHNRRLYDYLGRDFGW